jgi:hypothetical protein
MNTQPALGHESRYQGETPDTEQEEVEGNEDDGDDDVRYDSSSSGGTIRQGSL